MRQPGRLRRAVPATPHSGVEELFTLEYGSMLRLAFLLTRDQEMAEEVVQDAFLAVHQRWDRLLNPGGYLRTAVVNGSRRVAGRERNRRRILQRNATELAVATGVPQSEPIMDVVAQLPRRQREAIVLVYYGGLSSRELAEALGCPIGTAKSLVHRGLRRMRKELHNE